MPNSHAILSEIEAMLSEKQIGFDTLTHLEWIQQRKAGKTFTMSEHIRALVYSQLSNNRPWMQIESHINQIDEIFFGYDKERILGTSPDYFINEILAIRCGNRGIKKQMYALHGNIRKFERIEQEFGSLDRFIVSGTAIEIADLLANSLKYKIGALGLALAMEYLRNVGIDAAKPDTHICRVLGRDRLGYSAKAEAGEYEAVEIIDTMSDETGYTASQIDAILWLFCSDDNGMICTEKPNCSQCRLYGKYCNHE